MKRILKFYSNVCRGMEFSSRRLKFLLKGNYQIGSRMIK